MSGASLLPLETITQRIVVLREQKVLIDADLAALYGVETRRLNEQVRRNRERFPADFIFELAPEEFANLKSQFATSSWGGRRKLPLAFTEHGAIMAATVLNTPRAVEVSVYVVRAFVSLRELVGSHRELAKRLDDLEQKTEALAALLAELHDVLGREHLASRLAQQRSTVEQAIALYAELAIGVSQLATPRVVRGDVYDDHVIAAAVSGSAEVPSSRGIGICSRSATIRYRHRPFVVGVEANQHPLASRLGERHGSHTSSWRQRATRRRGRGRRTHRRSGTDTRSSGRL